MGGAAGAAGAAGVAEETVWFGYARRLEAWLQDCTTLVGYVPREAPVQQDHKRLLMLLHDLGGTLVLLQLLGALGEALVGAAALGELGGFIAGFGEENRKTAVSRALASATAVPAAPAEGAALLQRHGLCAQAAEEGAAAPEQDTWSEVGWRLCAALLLRAGRPEEAVALLKARTADAPTLHAFIGAFELASRVPPPRLPAGGGGEASSLGVSLGEVSPSRFSLEQVAEVLDAALLRPQHGLASEGNLLRRHLRTALSFGQPANAPPAPPLACPPPPPAQRQDAPRLVVVVPFVAAEKPRLLAGLRRWAAEARPCEPPAKVDAAGHAERGPVDLLLYAAWEAQPRSSSSSSSSSSFSAAAAAAAAAADDAWLAALAATPHGALGAAARCFRRVRVRHANLTKAQQYYIGGWENTGPNGLFSSLFFDAATQAEYDLAFWMEADVYPVAHGWLERLREEARAPRGFWRKGPAQQPAMSHAMVSPHHYHMNSAGFYRLGQPCFNEFTRRVLAEHPRQPHDVSAYTFLHDPRHFHIFQRHAHRFLYTDLVQNRLDEWTLEKVRTVSPDTVFVHGKSAPFDVGRGKAGSE